MARIYISGGGSGGTTSSDVTATKAQVLEGVTALTSDSNDEPATGTLLKSNILASAGGTITSKGAATYTPGTANQTIAAGQYLSGTQTIKGDSNLIASNILSGKQIFGVTGTGTFYKLVQKRLLCSSTTWTSKTLTFYNSAGTTAITTASCYSTIVTNLGITPYFYILTMADIYYKSSSAKPSAYTASYFYNADVLTINDLEGYAFYSKTNLSKSSTSLIVFGYIGNNYYVPYTGTGDYYHELLVFGL